MKKWVFIGIGIVLAGLIVGLFVYNFNLESEDIAAKTDPEPQQVDEVTGETESGTQATGKYLDYSEENIEKYKGKKKVVFFHAEWCPNCLALEKNVLAGNIPDDIVILKADFDRDIDLKKKYGVTVQTTLVQIDDNGDRVKLWVGSAFDDIDDIQEELI